MEIISAATLLFLVLDPLGNIPLFLFVLDKVLMRGGPKKRRVTSSTQHSCLCVVTL